MSEHRLYFSVSRPSFIIFSGIVSGFSSSFSTSCSSIAYLFRHCVRLSPIFIGIVSGFSSSSSIVCEHRLSFPASSPTFIIFSGTVSEFSSSSSASYPRIAYLFRHCVRLSPIFIGIVSGSLIFPGIVLGFLLVLQAWRLSSLAFGTR